MRTPKSATRPDAVLLDLDGTLADTAPDLANALNNTLINFGKTKLPFDAIRPHVSHGAKALIKLGFDIDEQDHDYAIKRQYLLDDYFDNIAEHTSLFAGMDNVLNTLESQNIPWGIVTNKPAYLTEPLISALQLDTRAACVVSGDTTPHSKPHPAPLLHACQHINVSASQCIYIGDAQRDIEAGRNAGMKTLAASFGYINKNDNIKLWGADSIIDHPSEIIDWIMQ